MSKIKLKNAFAFEDKQAMKLMKGFITRQMKLPAVISVYSDGEEIKDAIAVPMKNYEAVLIEGQKFALLEKLIHIHWINNYEQLVNILELQLAAMTLDSRKDRKDAIEYFQEMRKILPIIIDDSDEILHSKGYDYNGQMQILNEFIRDNGTGPFTQIKPLTRTGKMIEDQDFPILIKSR